jgi:hypothetical protein
MIQVTAAQEHPFAVGVIVGEPVGISAAMRVSEHFRLAGGIGSSMGGDRIGRFSGEDRGPGRFHVHLDVIRTIQTVFTEQERYPVYAGLGARINSGAGTAPSAALRGVIGIAWVPQNVPVDFFLEFVPMMQVTTPAGLGIDAAVGVRCIF